LIYFDRKHNYGKPLCANPPSYIIHVSFHVELHDLDLGNQWTISPAVFPMTTFDYWRALGPPIPTASLAHHPDGVASRMNLVWNLFKSLGEENPVVDSFSI